MNNSYKNWFKGGLLGVVAVMGMAACSDDHYDIVVTGETEGKTLWENIQANESLSDFASILSETSYLKNDMDYPTDSSATKISYADYLNASQALTVWAPINGSFDVDAKLAELAEIKALYATDRKAATKKEFIFASQFLGQHIARFNHESQGDDKEVRMLNAKYVVYDAAGRTFDGVAFADGVASMPSSNGTLHVLSAPSNYAYNIYDYLAAMPQFSKVYSVLSDPEFDITSFSPGLSTEGAMNSAGKMEYVDSVYSNYNTLLNQANAQIKNEDSIYVAVIPTDEAYDEALENAKKLFNYKKTYSYNWSNVQGDWGFSGTEALKLTDEQIDSLKTLNAQKLLFSTMYFTPSMMGENVNRTDAASIIDYCLYNDSVITTNFKTIYNKEKGSKNPLFLGKNNEDVTPMKASNGYIFGVNRYNLDAAYSYIERRELNPSILAQTNAYYENVSLGSYRNDSIADRFEVKSFTRIEVQATGKNMDFTISLPSLKSGSYKISAILVPTAYHKLYEEGLVNNKGVPYVENLTFDVTLLDDASKAGTNIGKTTGITAPSDRVEKIVLFEKLDLEYSYDGLPSGVNSFPRMKFSMTSRQTGSATSPKCLAMNIYKIIIEPYR
jgi:hypothetical protein